MPAAYRLCTERYDTPEEEVCGTYSARHQHSGIRPTYQRHSVITGLYQRNRRQKVALSAEPNTDAACLLPLFVHRWQQYCLVEYILRPNEEDSPRRRRPLYHNTSQRARYGRDTSNSSSKGSAYSSQTPRRWEGISCPMRSGSSSNGAELIGSCDDILEPLPFEGQQMFRTRYFIPSSSYRAKIIHFP